MTDLVRDSLARRLSAKSREVDRVLLNYEKSHGRNELFAIVDAASGLMVEAAAVIRASVRDTKDGA